MKQAFTRILISALILTTSLCSFASKKNNGADIFSSKRPYTVEIAQCSTLHQAGIITKRLDQNGIQSYILKTTSNQGKEEYCVVSGAFENAGAANVFKNQMYKTIGFKGTKLLSYEKMNPKSRVPVDNKIDSDTKKIDTNKPKVSPLMEKLIDQFPHSNLFEIKSIFLTLLNIENMSYKNDSYRGIYYYTPSIKDLDAMDYKELGFSAMGSITYRDNLTQNDVLFEVAKFNEKKELTWALYNDFKKSGIETHDFSKFNNYQPNTQPSRDLILAFMYWIADGITTKGETNLASNIQPVEYDNGRLIGYKVVIRQPKNIYQAYYLLTDLTGDYWYTIKTSKENDNELKSFITQIGKSKNLDEYNEFHNSFYLLPNQLPSNEELVLYAISKFFDNPIEKEAREHWGKTESLLQTIGHWVTRTCFSTNGKFSYAIGFIDNETKEMCKQIEELENKAAVKAESEKEYFTVYGRTGFMLNKALNLFFDKYYISGEIKEGQEKILIDRVEKFQFQKGGYTKP